MAPRAPHFGIFSIIASLALGTLAVFANNNHGAFAQAPQLSAVLSPASAQLIAGTAATFTVTGVYTDANGQTTNVVPATISWLPVGGTVYSYTNASVVIKAGSVVKTGSLGADITYAGLSAHADAPIKIIAAPAPATPTPTAQPSSTPTPSAKPSPTPTPTPPPAALSTPGPVSSADTTRLEALKSVFRPAKPTFSQPAVSISSLACIEKNLGARFVDVSSGQNQPTAADRQAAAPCFADADPLPAILAPVSPADIASLTSTSDTIIIGDVKKTADSTSHQITGLQVSGKGTPGANVYVYVFSDPLVRHTTVNSSGDWTYFINAELPVGKHELFAITPSSVAGSFVRTAAFPVDITAAATGASVPAKTGLPAWLAPLHLPDWVTLKMLYAAGAGLMLLMAIISFIVYARRRRRHSAAIQALASHMPGDTIMPSELLAAAPIAPAPPVSVDEILKTPLPKPSSGSTFLPGGTVPEEYRDVPNPPVGGPRSPKP